MEERQLVCRHCGRAIAVPASVCPWCRRAIMVICASCKQYTDDQEPVCGRCGAPLEADTLDDVRAAVGLGAEVARLAADRERARLVSSGVVARYLSGFFFDDGRRRTVVVELFGAPPNPRRMAAVLLFSATAYLVEEGYCGLVPEARGEELEWVDVRQWDGQVLCVEGALAQRAGLRLPFGKAIDQLVADEMGFRFEVVKPPRIRTPGMPRQPAVRDLSAHSATAAIVELGRQAELPGHQEAAACRETYALLMRFVQSDPGRARYLAEQILEVLDWFERYEAEPALALMR